MSSEKPVWGTPENGQEPGYQEVTPREVSRPSTKNRRTGLKVAGAVVLALAGAGVLGAAQNFSDGGSSGYERIAPEDSLMCQLLPPESVDSVLGGSAAYEDRIYDGDTCEYLAMQTDLGYNVTLRLTRDELDADMVDYYRESIEDDITSTEAVEVEDVGDIAALDRPDHELDFISGGVQYRLTLDNNDYEDKLPSSKEEQAASAELARIVLDNAN
jgi:hypothetical protein